MRKVARARNSSAWGWDTIWQKKLMLAAGLFVNSAGQALSADYIVGSSDDFFSAMQSVRVSPTAQDTITFTNDFTMSRQVLAILRDSNSTLIIDGNNKTLDGGGSFRPFFVAGGNVTIKNMTITNARAKGGDGSGGGMGAGAAVFVNQNANVRLENVAMTTNSAVGGNAYVGDVARLAGGGGLGGNGGIPSSLNISGAGGGGGGLYGNGGTPGPGGGGGGGELGSGGAGSLQFGNVGGGGGGRLLNGTDGIVPNPGVGGGSEGGNGGSFVGNVRPQNGQAVGGGGGGGAVHQVGGAGNLFGGGGGSGASSLSLSAPNGGDFGGGGGGAGYQTDRIETTAGNGGFGGGGGGTLSQATGGGNGGFGGGAGANNQFYKGAGFGGGNASTGMGGGGAGFGGAIFVRAGGTITVAGNVTFNGNSVTGGTGATVMNPGSSDGPDLFAMRGTNLVVDIENDFSTALVLGNNDGTSNPGMALTKAGQGALILTGNSPLAGTMTINQGSVFVNGSYGGNIVVNSDAALAGTGQVGSLTVNGTVSPGTTGLGTLHVAGNYVQNAGSGYALEIAPNRTSDQIDITGTAQLAGNLMLLPQAGNYAAGTQYRIMTAAGGITGQFDQTTGTPIDGLLYVVAYAPTDLILVLVSTNPNLQQHAVTDNHSAVTQAIVSAVNTPGTHNDLLVVINAADNQGTQPSPATAGILTAPILSGPAPSSPEQSRLALDHLSGEFHGGVRTVQLQNSTFQTRLLSERMIGLLNSNGGESFGPSMVASSSISSPAPEVQLASFDPASQSTQNFASHSCQCAPASPSWVGWKVGFGQGATIASNGNFGGVDSTMGGFLVGADHWLSEDTIIGLYGGYAHSSISGTIADGRARINGFEVGMQYAHRKGSSYVTGLLGYAHDDVDTDRFLNFGEINRQARGNSNGHQFIKYTEMGLSLPWSCQTTLQPFIGLQYIHLNQAGFTETGAGSAGLIVDGENLHSLRTSLGTRLFSNIEWKGIPIVVSAQARWMHEYLDTTQFVSAQFIGAPTSNFVVSGADAGRDLGIVGIGAAVPLTSSIYLFGAYDLQFGDRYTAHTGSGGLAIQW